MSSFRDRRVDFELARVAIDMLLLVGPDEPEAATAADEARAIFERLGAKPYLDQLDIALAAAAPLPAVPAAKAR